VEANLLYEPLSLDFGPRESDLNVPRRGCNKFHLPSPPTGTIVVENFIDPVPLVGMFIYTPFSHTMATDSTMYQHEPQLRLKLQKTDRVSIWTNKTYMYTARRHVPQPTFRIE
jgi:hypothetical protein